MELGSRPAVVAGVVDRIAEAGDRLGEPAVVQGVLGGRGGDVGRVVARRVHRVEVQDDADLGVGDPGAQPLDGEAVTEEQVVGGGEAVGDGRAPGRHEPGDVAEVARAVRLVERRPVLDPVAEGRGHDVGVLGEVVRRRPLRPAALVLERLGQVPVVERHVRLDSGGEQLVDEPVVEVEAGGSDVTAAVGDHPRPRDREPVGAEAELAHQPDVGCRRARGARRRRRRCCRRGSPRGPCRSGPRCSRRGPPGRPRSGTTTSPRPTRTRREPQPRGACVGDRAGAVEAIALDVILDDSIRSALQRCSWHSPRLMRYCRPPLDSGALRIVR